MTIRLGGEALTSPPAPAVCSRCGRPLGDAERVYGRGLCSACRRYLRRH